jgi:hypothetical protein
MVWSNCAQFRSVYTDWTRVSQLHLTLPVPTGKQEFDATITDFDRTQSGIILTYLLQINLTLIGGTSGPVTPKHVDEDGFSDLDAEASFKQSW